MRIVLDTNVLLVSLPSHSRYHPIFAGLKAGQIQLYLSNEILSEYEEVISRKLGIDRADLHLTEILNLSNVHKSEPYYLWQLIEADKDDNKFVDCAISCNADYLVSNDGHYDVLETIEFPKVTVIKAARLLELLKIAGE